MQRFSRRNLLGWIGGAAAFVISAGLQLNVFNRYMFGAMGIALVVLLAFWTLRGVERRRHVQRLREFASTHGWTYSESGGVMIAGLAGYPFGEGAERTVEDVIEGTYSGRECASFTYTFEYRTSDDPGAEQIFSVTQAVLEVPFPRLDLIPEDIGSRALNAVGFADIDLESAEFNRKWRVQCQDKRFAIDVVDPRMMQLLLNTRMQGVAVRIDGNRVLAWSAGVAHVKDLSRRLDLVAGVANRIPAHVVRKYTDADTQRRAEEAAREAKAPGWAKTGGILNSGHYTGIGTDANGDGVEDWEQRRR